jgi:transposase
MGRKRHVLVDTEGNILAVLVLPADISDRDAAALLLRMCRRWYPELRLIWVDGAYRGDLERDAEAEHGIVLTVVSKVRGQKGFVPLPRRWVVERTFAWMVSGRRLRLDYEREPAYSEAWVYLAEIHRLLKRLAPDRSLPKPYQRRKAA